MRGVWLVFCGATLPMLGGCIAARPAAPFESSVTAPSNWRTSYPTSASMPDACWWRLFGDVALDRLMERAIRHNAEVGQAAARVAEARAIADQARASRLPELDLSGSGSRARNVTLGIPVTSLGGGADVAVAWDLDLFGRLASSQRAARAAWLSSRAAHDAVRLAVLGDTARNYIELLAADARLTILRATLASRESSLRIARRRNETGYASRLELHEADGEYASTAQLVPQAELEVATLENAIGVLTGEAPRAIERTDTGLAALTVPSVPVALPSELLRRRPDLVAAEETLVAADHRLDSARAAMMPDVMLAGALGRVYADTLPTPFTVFSLGGSLVAPLLDAGRRKSEADANAARRDGAAYAYRATALNAFREVEDALAAIPKLEAQRRAAHHEVDADAERLRILTQRTDTGYTSSIDRLDAQRRLLSAQLASVQSDAAWFTSHVQLIKVTGGGWSPSVDTSSVVGVLAREHSP